MPGRMNIQEQLESGLSNHQAGRLAEAESACREVLRQQPDHAEALNLLGTLVAQQGRWDAAAELIRRAIAVCPTDASFHNHLGKVLSSAGQIDQAIDSHRQAIQLKPDFAHAHSELGIALHARGQLDEAVASFRRAVQLLPDSAPAHYNLGNALRSVDLDEAIASYRQAVRLKPDYVKAYNNLGSALTDIGQLDEAIAIFHRTLQLKPDHSAAHNNLGLALQKCGQLNEAIASIRAAIRFEPDLADAYNNLGRALTDVGQLDEAVACCRHAVRLKPDYAEAHNNLANALKDMGRLDEAIVSYQQAMRFKPGHPDAPSNLVFALLFHSGSDAKTIHAEHLRWNRVHAESLRKSIQPHTNNRDPDRRLRIGYVSADFRNHSVSRFLLPLFRNHDHEAYEIICYSDVTNRDGMTDALRGCADEWHNIVGRTDERVADRIRQDQIDILVDLAGHTGGNRLRIFARKPAPVQVSYLGYPATTGLSEIDYRLSDSFADPPGQTESLYSETLWRLPVCNWCYGEPENAPPVRTLPADRPIRFGTFNNLAKVSSPIMDLWAAILIAMPSSRLVIKSQGVAEESVRRRINQCFMSRGLQPDRLELRGHEPIFTSHLEAYNQLDIALDTFPYHGTTTTCEALWMGVPVVTLAGSAHVSRVGVSLLSCVDLPELVAKSPEEYVSIAVGLAKDLPRLAELRRTLRLRMRASPLMDGARFARDIESAYRQMWRARLAMNAKSV